MPETHVYDDTAWREVTEWHVYDGSSWRELSDVWVYDGSAWRKVYEVSSCDCTGVTVDSDALNSDVSNCQCTTSPKIRQQVRICYKWNYSGATNACHHAHMQYSATGSSWYTLADNLAVDIQQSGTIGCSGTWEGEYEYALCQTHLRYYRVRLELDSDSTVCDTGTSRRSTNCIA